MQKSTREQEQCHANHLFIIGRGKAKLDEGDRHFLPSHCQEMAQKEVIHLTLGTFSQHISTHFYNQQSSHFQYGEKASEDGGNDDLLLDPNVDFQAGIGSRRNEQTFFPREVLVGFKGDMGTGWDAYTVTMEEDEEGDAAIEEEEDDVVLRPSNAVNEGLHAWYRPAELLHTASKGAVRPSRAYIDPYEDEGELSASDSEEEAESTLATTEASPMESDSKMPSSAPKSKARAVRYRTPASYAANPHHPRSLCPLPCLYGSGSLVPMGSMEDADGSNPFSSFEMGMALAKEMERESSISEDNIRWFAEDSDLLQSFQVTTDTSDGFAGFTNEMLQSLADEYPKTPVMTWGAQWGSMEEGGEESTHTLGRLRKMNNILSLWSLSSSSFYIPMQVPPHLTHSSKKQKDPLHYFSSKTDWTDQYQASALLSAHIDTATLRTRLRSPELSSSAASMIASLNWRRDTPIGSLGGCFPTPLLAPTATKGAAMDPIEALLASRGYGSRERARNERDFETPQERAIKAAKQIQKHFINYSSPAKSNGVKHNFAEYVVARDNDALAASPTREALEVWSHLQEPVGQTTFAGIPFNIQSASFPQMFRNLTSTGRPVPEDYSDMRPRVQSIPMLSSLSTASSTAAILQQARRYLDKRVIKGHEALQSFGLGGARGASAGQAANDESEGPLGGRDGLIEIRERLEELLGAYEGDDGDKSEDERLDTDEEYDDQVEEWVLDDD
jgi:hypothetical protein